MAKKKKRLKDTAATGEGANIPAAPKAPERLSSPFKDALLPLKKQLDEQAKQATQKPAVAPAPRPMPATPVSTRRQKALAEDEATALSLAMHGVKPLLDTKPARVTTTPRVESRTAKVAPFGASGEDQARARLDALVAQDVSFRIESDRDFIRGARSDAPPRIVRELARRTRVSETLDLHGMNQREAREAVAAFVRKMHKLGLDHLCVVHGKGQHSEGGQGVLRDVVVRALTETGAAPLVLAFATAPDALGGSGALVVELKR